MKSRKLFACLVVMLPVSTITMGEIVMTPHWNGYGDVYGCYVVSDAKAAAFDEQDYQISWAHGGWSLITTEADLFDWWYYCEASASALIFVYDETTCWAWGKGEAGASVIYEENSYGVEAEAFVYEKDCGPPPDYCLENDVPDPITEDGTNYFEAYEGMWASHDVITIAEIFTGGDNVAKGWAHAGASIGLDPNEP